MADAALIECKDVSFAYGAIPVLEQIDFTVHEGEFLGIVGPNAGGKSTLLKLILGLLKPQVGTVKVLGDAAGEHKQEIGYVAQYPSFPRDFPITVEQTVLMGLLGATLSLGIHSKKDREVTARSLREVEIHDLAQRQIGTLSGGQLQRVLLARALVSQPRILILDEPTANIDQRMESDIFDLLKQLNQRMTILVVSHDIAFISSYVSQVACLNRTLVCHHTKNVDSKLIQELYGRHISMVAHRH